MRSTDAIILAAIALQGGCERDISRKSASLSVERRVRENGSSCFRSCSLANWLPHLPDQCGGENTASCDAVAGGDVLRIVLADGDGTHEIQHLDAEVLVDGRVLSVERLYPTAHSKQAGLVLSTEFAVPNRQIGELVFAIELPIEGILHSAKIAVDVQDAHEVLADSDQAPSR